MAMSKIERIDKEIQKTREKITEYQNRLRGLEAQKTEAENLQIVQLVRSMRLTPQELTAMLAGGGIPGIAPMPADYEEQEDKRFISPLSAGSHAAKRSWDPASALGGAILAGGIV